MPGAGTKQQKSEPIPSIRAVQIAPSAVLSDFEEMCVELSASGALIAVRDLAGLRTTVSFGIAPAVGSRLPTDFPFLNQCLETGEFAVCEDAESDPRISPSLAVSLSFLSAVAVPIPAQGSVVGLMEVFSSRPSAIDPIAIARLTEIAKSFAAIMIFDAANGGLPIVGGPMESPIVLPRLIAEELAPATNLATVNPDAPDPDAGSPDHANLHTRGIEAPQKQQLHRTAAATSLLPSDRPIPTRVWLIAAILLVGLSLLLLFLFRSSANQSTSRTNTNENIVGYLVPS